jgi:hypothetical protein
MSCKSNIFELGWPKVGGTWFTGKTGFSHREWSDLIDGDDAELAWLDARCGVKAARS